MKKDEYFAIWKLSQANIITVNAWMSARGAYLIF